MQTSGTAPNFSDGARKTITTKPPRRDLLTPGDTRDAPKAKAPAVARMQAKPSAANTHRRGGHAQHQKGRR